MQKKNLWEPIRKTEKYYQRKLLWLFNKVISESIGLDFNNILQNVIELTNSKTFLDFSANFAKTMLTTTNDNVYKTWRHAVLGNTKSQLIYNRLQADINNDVAFELQKLMDENIMYIKSQPVFIAEKIVQIANQYVQEGRRSEEIRNILLRQYPHMTKSKATLIARTEASKASNNLVQVRAQRLNMNWYKWITAKDQRVRTSHAHMNGVIANFNDPPSPEKLIGKKSQGEYNPGNFPNCRCFASIIVDIDLIKFPAKVYYNGQIVRMTRKQFKRII